MLSSFLSCAHTHFNMNSSVSGWCDEFHHRLPTWPELCVETLPALDSPGTLCISSLALLESEDHIRMLQQPLCSAMFFQGVLMDPLLHRAVAWVGIGWVPDLWHVSSLIPPPPVCSCSHELLRYYPLLSSPCLFSGPVALSSSRSVGGYESFWFQVSYPFSNLCLLLVVVLEFNFWFRFPAAGRLLSSRFSQCAWSLEQIRALPW